MIYECHFPGCDYRTERKSLIDHHHVIPREVEATKFTIPFCKNHHALIYVPEATAGQHFINTEESIQIIQIYDSTCGKVLHYRDYNQKEFLYFLDSKEITDF